MADEAQSEIETAVDPKHQHEQFEDHLIQSLDMLIFAELIYLFYLDNSLLRLLGRIAVQANFLSPKSALLASIQAQSPRSTVYYVFGSAILCILCHLLLDLPSVGEDSEKYLRGGLIIDFVGQRSSGRLRLIYVDISILILQLYILALSAPKLFHNYSALDHTVEDEELGQRDVLHDEHVNSRIVADINVLKSLRQVWHTGSEPE